MSKTSKPADLWRQLDASAHDREDFCPGCGYYHAVHRAHRDDCTAEQP